MDYANGASSGAALYGGALPTATNVEIFEKPPPSVKLETVVPDVSDYLCFYLHVTLLLDY